MKPVNIHDIQSKVTPSKRGLVVTALKMALPLVVLAGAYYGYQALVASKPEVASRPPVERSYVVDVSPAEFQDRRPQIRVFGELTAGREVELRALVSGEIIDISPALRKGGTISEGDEVIRIDPFNFDGALIEAQANLQLARASRDETLASLQAERDALESANEQLDLSMRDLERARALVERGALSTQTVEARELIVSERSQAKLQRDNNLAIQAARLTQREAEIKRLEWQLQRAERDLENTVLRAPFNGIVMEKNAEEGRIVSTNDLVVRLTQADDMEVSFTLSDAQFGRLIRAGGDLSGSSVTVTWQVGNQPLELDAVISRIAPEIDQATGGVSVLARVETPENVPLRPGAFVEVSLPDQLYKNVMVMPETALFEGNVVFAVVDDRLVSKSVEIVGYDGDMLLMRSDIPNGTPILTTALSVAGDGLKVRLRGDEASAEDELDAGGIALK